jgi:hypothetical protein
MAEEENKKLETLWRGVYGDKQNDIPGVIHDVAALKKTEKKLQKYFYVGIGVIGTIEILIEVAKRFI